MVKRGHMKEIRKGTWRCKIYVGKDTRNKKRYKTVTLRGTERDVQRRLRDIADRERARGQLPVSSRTTLAAFLEFWMTKYGEKQLRPTTVENYRSIIRNHIAPEVGDVDLEKGIIRISQQIVCLKGKVHFQPPKTKKSNGVIRISEEVAAILRRHRQAQQEEKLLLGEAYQDHGLVFATKIGTPVNPRNFIRRHFKPALERAGLPLTTRFHDLRHTAATLMPANNEDVATISEKLRHARRSTTVDMYIHSATDVQYREASGWLRSCWSRMAAQKKSRGKPPDPACVTGCGRKRPEITHRITPNPLRISAEP
jgi:integrase